MNCPSCGAEIEADTRFSNVVVCESCDSTVVLDAAAARVAGKMATLKPPSGVLYTGATGELGGKRFQVLGRVRYGYAAGLWDEWFLGMEDGQAVWISEDEDDLIVETFTRLEAPPFTHDSLGPGDQIRLGGKGFTVTEKDVATCEGGEGQLPFMIVPGERVPFLDLTGDDSFGTVEFDEHGVMIFVGKRIDPGKLELDRTRQEAGIGGDWMSAERAAGAGGRERIVQGAGDRMAKIKCTSCGAPQSAPAQGATTHECEYCGDEIDLLARQVDCPNCDKVIPVKAREAAACVVCPKCQGQLDISKDSPTLIAQLASKRRPVVPIKLGQTGTLKGTAYQVVGHIRFVERSMWGTYISDEFFMRPLEKGMPCWLVLENGHWSIGHEVTGQAVGISHPRSAAQQSTFAFGSETWKVYEHCEAPMAIDYVEGELPWVAQVGDKFEYMDAIAPPKMLSAEWTASEMEWFEAEYLAPEAVAAGFGLAPSELPVPEGIGACQPFRTTPFKTEAPIVLAAFFLLVSVMLFASWDDGYRCFSQDIPLADVHNAEFITEPFKVSQAPGVFKVWTRSNVSNSWLYVRIALIDAEDKALLECDTEMSYYHGRDYEGYWSEGYKYDYAYFTLDKPGEYRLLVTAPAGGTGNYGKDFPGGAGPLKVQVFQGVGLSRYYFFLALIYGGLALWWGSARFRFEASRWGQVIESDD